MNDLLAAVGNGFPPVDQDYPFQPREMQTLSLAVKGLFVGASKQSG